MTIGKLFVFEGADEVGKTTLASMLAEAFRANGRACELIGFPGNEVGTLGRHIYELHHKPKRFQVMRIDPTSLQMLHVAAHIDLIEHCILPALRSKRTVVLDRFWWSAWVYGTAGGAKPASLKIMVQAEMIHWKRIRPDRVFLITSRTPFEPQADHSKWKRISALYRKLASQEESNYPVTQVRNDSAPEAAFLDIRRHVDGL